MILIGQYDSPFVRRVGIALTLYGLPFEHRPWSAFGDADKIRPYNPLTRVPTLVLDNGEVLIESHLMLDYLDSLVAADRRMFPTERAGAPSGTKIAALATGLGDKSVSLFYERRLHEKVSDLWVGRCRKQIESVLAVHWKRTAPRGPAPGGSATVSAMPTSRLPPCCVSSAKRIRVWFRWPAFRRWKPTPRGWRHCRSSRRFPAVHRAGLNASALPASHWISAAPACRSTRTKSRPFRRQPAAASPGC